MLSLASSVAGGFAVSALTIHGSVISEFGDRRPPGIYKFDTTGPESFTPVAGGEGILSQGGGVLADGKYYSINADNLTLNVYDTDTWALERSIPNANATLDMTYVESEGNIYGCFIEGGVPTLGILDTATGGYEPIGMMNMPILTLMSDADGNLYCIDQMNCALFSVDKTNAAMNYIGATGIWAMSAQSAIIDPESGKCYWTATCSDLSSGLYEVNLQTGEATLLYDFDWTPPPPVTGLFILPEVNPLAPDKVSGLVALFDGGSTSGTLEFTMPDKDRSGGTLTGNLDWALTVNDQPVSSGKAPSGEKVSLPLSLDQGNCKFAVTVSNEHGEGGKAVLTKWIGYDTPSPVSDLRLEKLSPDRLSLSWTMPTTGAHGGYVDLGNQRCNVVRYPGNVAVEVDPSGTSLTETVSVEKLASYYYIVTVEADGATSEEVSSNHITMGPAKEIPYTEEFSSTIQFNYFMVTDGNADGYTWEQNLGLESASYPGQLDLDADDWLVTPPIALDELHNYRLRFNVCANTFDTHRIEVKLGQLPNIKDLNVEVLPATDVVNGYNWQTFEVNFHVDHAGDYYLGLHMVSAPVSGSLDLDNLSVEAIGSTLAPAAPSELKAVAYANGELGAEISLKAPGSLVNGQPLTGTFSVTLKRDGEVVETFQGVSAGNDLRYDDPGAVQGFNTYTAVATNGDGDGEVAETKVFVGIDTPAKVGNIVVSETSTGHVTISWDTPEAGVNGGYVNPDNLTYKVMRNGWKEVSVGESALTAEDFVEESLNTQQSVFYVVIASSPTGDGPDAQSDVIVVGTPYELPFRESFANGVSKTIPWASLPMGGMNSWSPWPDTGGVAAQDQDGGLLALSCWADKPEGCRVVSPKIRIANTVNPVLEFYVAHAAVDDNLDIEIIADGRQAAPVIVAPLGSEELDWQPVRLPLTDYADCEYVQLALGVHNVSSGDKVYVDNVSLIDDLDDNLAAGAVESPAWLTAGQSAKVKATVRNVGRNVAESYTVNLYAGEELLASAGGPAIQPGAEAVVELEFVPLSGHAPEMSLYSKIDYDADENLSNNTSAEFPVSVKVVDLPVVGSLTGRVENGNTVVLEWTAPDTSEGRYPVTTDDFESYESFTLTEMGGWKPVEGDPDHNYCMEFMNSDRQFIVFPGDFAWNNYAFTVVDLLELPTAHPSDGWSSLSGDKFLLTAYSSLIGGSGAVERNGDYLISPRLNGIAQEITVNAKSLNYDDYGLETIEILASSTDTDLGSFTVVDTRADVPTDWTSYNFRLPEGTLYFAIHAVSTYTALFLDDISYIAEGAVKETLEVAGYNVYRDSRRINTELVTEPRFTDITADPQVSHEYAVSAVYSAGESALSETLSISMSGVGNIKAASAVSVTTSRGMIHVRNCVGGMISVYAADGRMAGGVKGTGANDFTVQPGFYVVVVEGVSHKVVVN